MTKNTYILPMRRTRRIIFLVYDGFELLDLSGPAAVFSTAAELAGEDLYRVVVAGLRAGSAASGCGVAIATQAMGCLAVGRGDTVLVVGAYEAKLRAALRNPVLLSAIAAACAPAERFGSVCSGTFLLGAAGLLDRKRVATHWSACRRLAAVHARTAVEADALYVNDGRLWTSAGVTTGIDMALAMLERDHGHELTASVARQLVVYAHRPGHQSQFSAVLDAQGAAAGSFSSLIAWLERHIGDAVGVPDMAREAGMSERTFHRKFTQALGITPSRFLDGLRLGHARAHLESGLPVKAAAARVGFASESAFRSAFRAQFGVTPGHHARMHTRDNS